MTAKQKTYRFWFRVQGTGFVDIQATNEEQAEDIFNGEAEATLLAELDSIDWDIDEVEEIKL